MSEYLRSALEQLQSQRDQRIVRERNEIAVTAETFDKTIHQIGKLYVLAPNTFQNAAELCSQLTIVMNAMDRLYAEIRESEDIGDKTFDTLLYVRDAMLQQFCCTDKTMIENYRFLEGQAEHHFRFDILCFLALVECVACLSAVPAFWESLSKRWDGEVVPSVAFPELCRKTVISRSLHRKKISEFNVFDIVEALKYLEFKWCILKYSDELPDYLDVLLCRIAELYKEPQPFIIFTNIDDYMRPISETEAVFSDRMIEELCWSLRPMYQKVFMYRQLARHTSGFPISDADEALVQQLATDNARRMNNKTISEDFRTVYMRFAMRPSELLRFYRDKPGRYANPALIMKNARSSESVNRMMDKLDNPAWLMVDRDADLEDRPTKRKGLFDRAATDLMYILLIDSWLGNLWQLDWVKIFVIYNLDLLEQRDTDAWFRVDYPLVVQSFNHFDVFYKGTLYRHSSAAKAFCHWYSIMMRPPFNGYYNNQTLESYELKTLKVLMDL